MITHPQVYAAIAAVQAELAKIGIEKADTNTYDKYKYRGIDSLYDTLSPILSRCGLMILPRVVSRQTEERPSKSGGTQLHTTLSVEYDLVAKDGSKHTIVAMGEAMDRGDKSLNKAFTAAYKYAMFQTFCIPLSGAMEDADNESPEVGSDPVVRSMATLKRQVAKCRTPEQLRDLWRAVANECKGATPADWEERKDLLTARAEALKEPDPMQAAA